MAIPYQNEILKRFDEIYETILPEIVTCEDVLKLSIADQTVVLVTHFDAEVMNGGIDNWLRHGTGSLTYETLHAMERIGANITSGVIRQMHDVLEQKHLSRDHEQRNAQIDALSVLQQSRLEELSDIYGDENGREGDTIFEKVYRFLQSHSV